MNYCSECGQPTQRLVPDGDSRERDCCPACGAVHYQNPRIIAACIPEWQDQVLMCRRAIQPRKGYWTLPAGFMELDESIEQAAARETLEEAEAVVEIGELYAIFNLSHIGQVYMVYRAQMKEPVFGCGAESEEVCLMREEEIPWDDLAFETMRRSLRYFFEDRRQGLFQFRSENIDGQRKSRNDDQGWLS